ncbi:hypothetical protein [Streptomyces sp. SAI-129]|uniref:hypothetical protein n=1 Tax=Streptomyces sp. SAI-129 TaxID=3377727 RepID=UPI003C7DE653
MSRTAQVSRAAVYSAATATLLMGGFFIGAVSGSHAATEAAVETLSSGSPAGPAGVNIGWDSVPLNGIGWDSPGIGRTTEGTSTQAAVPCSSFICT